MTITGEVMFPGTYALLSKKERLSSLISRAGSVLRSGYPEAAVLTRPSRGVGRIGFDLKAVLADSGVRDTFVLEPDDTLYIPRFIPTVKVSGSVNSPIAVAHLPGKRLRYYVEAAGGDTYLADYGRAFFRQPNGVVEPYKRRFLLPDRNPRPLAGADVVVPSKDPNDKKDRTSIAGSIAAGHREHRGGHRRGHALARAVTDAGTPVSNLTERGALAALLESICSPCAVLSLRWSTLNAAAVSNSAPHEAAV